MAHTYQTVFPRVILEAIHALDKRSGNETRNQFVLHDVGSGPAGSTYFRYRYRKRAAI